jgi:hypothetical protein
VFAELIGLPEDWDKIMAASARASVQLGVQHSYGMGGRGLTTSDRCHGVPMTFVTIKGQTTGSYLWNAKFLKERFELIAVLFKLEKGLQCYLVSEHRNGLNQRPYEPGGKS